MRKKFTTSFLQYKQKVLFLNKGKYEIIAVITYVLFCSVLNPELYAKDYFVRSKGQSNGNGLGTSYSNAWDGIVNIKWSEIKPGDTLYVCGTIFEEYFNIEISGNSTANIIIDGGYFIDPGTIDANNNITHGIRCVGKKNITIRNIRIENGKSTGIGVEGANICITNVSIYNSGHNGISAKVQDLEITDTKIFNTRHTGCWITKSRNAHLKNILVDSCGQPQKNNDNFFIGDGSTNFLIENCVAKNNYSAGTGFDISGDILRPMSGKLRACWAENVHIGYGASAGGDVSQTVIFEYCAAISCTGAFFFLKENVTAKIYNCLGYSKKLCDYIPVNFSGSNDRDKRIITLKNSIFCGKSKYPILGIRETDIIDSSNNCWFNFLESKYFVIYIKTDNHSKKYTFSAWRKNGFDKESFYQDPKFISPDLKNFHLADGSVCIDAGVKIEGVYRDFLNEVLPKSHSGKIDIGLFEQ